MASIPFTLAALATSAVPDLQVFGVRALDPHPDFAQAVIISEDAELLVRVPRTQAAETLQRGELLGLAALTEGPRSQLPFSAPEARGMTRAGQTRAVVTTYLPGGQFDIADLSDDALLIESIAQTIAAIHSLPTSVAQHGGLPSHTANDARLSATRLIDRAAQTRLVPATVLRRWYNVVEDAQLWDFAPTMVHGTLSDEQLRVEEDQVTGVLGWSACAVNDPALDFFWLLGASSSVLDRVLLRYAELHDSGMPAKLRARVALYHELEVARWLLQGVESHSQDIVDDAIVMLDGLVSGNHTLSAALDGARQRAPLTEMTAEEILSETPEVIDYLSDTAAYEALDEDRMFSMEREFADPEGDGGVGGAGAAGGNAGAAGAGAGAGAGSATADTAADFPGEDSVNLAPPGHDPGDLSDLTGELGLVSVGSGGASDRGSADNDSDTFATDVLTTDIIDSEALRDGVTGKSGDSRDARDN